MDFSSLLLVVHLLIALSMVGIILLQPSDGGGTGLGSDSGNSSFSAVRGKGSFLTRMTWGLAIAFMAVALLLAWLSRAPSSSGLTFDPASLNSELPVPSAPVTPDAFSNEAASDDPATPQADAAAQGDSSAPQGDSGAASGGDAATTTEGSAGQ